MADAVELRKKHAADGRCVYHLRRGSHLHAKRRYISRRRALGKYRDRIPPFRVYECPGCGYWHRASRKK